MIGRVTTKPTFSKYGAGIAERTGHIGVHPTTAVGCCVVRKCAISQRRVAANEAVYPTTFVSSVSRERAVC